VQVRPEQGESFVLQLDNPQGKRINLRISHSGFGIAVDTVIQSVSYGCRYRFYNADEGMYTIRVSSGRQVVTKDLQLVSSSETMSQIEISK
jgi:hypothetical protein